MKAKAIGIKQDRNVAKTTPKPRNNMPKLQKLLSKGHLIPIYEALGGDLWLVGYQRKATSRKASHRPFMLQQRVVVAKLHKNPEPTTEESSLVETKEPPLAAKNPERSQKNINEE